MISIIIPVYRSEKTLERCIESLKKQSYTQIEIIMIVDGPPDASGILADKLAESDARIRVIHQKNQGVSAARNAGIAAAAGDYLQFVDSDDYVDATLCERMVRTMEQQQADLVICGFHHLYFGKDVIKLPKQEGLFALREGEEQLLTLYRTGFLNMPWNKLFRRELIRDGFRQDMDLGEDLLFNISYCKQCQKLFVLQEALCYYIQDERGTTLSTKKRENRRNNSVFLYQQMKAFCNNIYGSEKTGGILESKLMVEFLDEMEGLAFQPDLSRQEKLASIRDYYQSYADLLQQEKLSLLLPDYRILFFFFARRRFGMTLRLVELRGLIVRLVRRLQKQR